MLCESRTSRSMRGRCRRVQRDQRTLRLLGLSVRATTTLLRMDAGSRQSSGSSMLQDPIRQSVHRVGRESLFDRARLLRQAHIAMLKLMIEPGQLDDLEGLVAAIFERFLNQLQIFLRRDL